MRRLLALAVLACAIVPAAALAQTRSTSSAAICTEAATPSCTGYYHAKPAGITFGTNAAYSLGHLKWSHWGSSKATSNGQAFYRYYTRQPKVRVTASKLSATCGTTLTYTELQIVTGKKTATYTGCALNLSK
jgi:opacity protein-like surface antigen